MAQKPVNALPRPNGAGHLSFRCSFAINIVHILFRRNERIFPRGKNPVSHWIYVIRYCYNFNMKGGERIAKY